MDIKLFLRNVNIIFIFSHVSVPQPASGFMMQKKNNRWGKVLLSWIFVWSKEMKLKKKAHAVMFSMTAILLTLLVFLLMVSSFFFSVGLGILGGICGLCWFVCGLFCFVLLESLCWRREWKEGRCQWKSYYTALNVAAVLDSFCWTETKVVPFGGHHLYLLIFWQAAILLPMPIWMLVYIFALNVFSYKLSYLDSSIFLLSG